MGLKLPEYTADGMVYMPNSDLSVRQSHSLRGLESSVAEAVEKLVPARYPWEGRLTNMVVSESDSLFLRPA
jgi:hypothetical protein